MALPAAMSFFFALILLGIPVWAVGHGASAVELGYLGAIGSLVYLLSVPFSGRLSDRYNPRAVGTVAALLFAAAAACIPFTRTLPPLYAIVAVYSFALSLYWPSLESQLAHVLHAGNLSQRTGLYNISWSSGIAVGTLAGGYIYEAAPVATFYLAAAGAALLPLLFFVFPPLTVNHDTEIPPPPPPHPHAHPVFLPVARLSNVAFWFGLGILRSIFPKLALDLGLSASWIGILLCSLSLGMALVFALYAVSGFWQFRRDLLLGSQGLALFGLLVVAVSSSPAGFLLGFAVIGLAAAHSYSGGLYYSLYFSTKPGEAEPSTVGHNSGLHEFFIGLGGFFGPLLGGPLAKHVHPRLPYLVAGAVMVLVMVGSQLWIKRALKQPSG